MLEFIEDNDENYEENKENMNESRAETSMSNSTFNTTSGSQRVENKEANVDRHGYLDLSKHRLTSLSKSLEKEYLKVRHLNVSNNEIRFFSYITFFKNCEKINASENQIQKFQTNHNLLLNELILANNQLSYADGFNRFLNLKKLDLSSNNIKDKITLSLLHLEVLNLSSNGITEIPDIQKCSVLKSLDLSSNEISDITKLSELVCPTNITFLSLRSNNISELVQFKVFYVFHKLVDVCVANNPCVDDLLEDHIFNPFSCVVACCYESLKKIDGRDIDENTKAEGDYLSMDGKIRKFAVEENEKLIKYVSSLFPASYDEKSLTPAQKTCRKVMLKQKENSSSRTDETDRTLNSVYSPFREWEAKVEARGSAEREKRNNSSTNILDGTVTPKRRSSALNSQSIRIVSPPSSRRNMSISYGNEYKSASESKNVMNTSAPLLSRTNSTDSTATITISSARVDTSFSLDENDDQTPTPVCDNVELNTFLENKTERVPSVADETYREDNEPPTDRTKKLEDKVYILEKQVSVLAEQNEQLTKTNLAFMETLEAFQNMIQEERSSMIEMMQKMIPKPENLIAKPLENSDGTYVVKWEMPVVAGYEIWINGRKSGRVIGKNKTAKITDLDAESEHIVQVQAICSNDIAGELSEQLRIKTT